jgi:ribokinase
MANSTIMVVGSINMDLVVRASHWPPPGENTFGRDFRMFAGGKGANQAIGVAKLGRTVMLAGRVGTDHFGDVLLGNLQANGVDITNVERDGQTPTGVALILINDQGENSIVIATGANGEFSAESARRLRALIASVHLVLLQLELPVDVVAEVVTIARSVGKRVVLDAGPPCHRPPPALFAVTVLSPNEAEAGALAGLSVSDEATATQAAHALLTRGPEAVVLKLGAKGALLATSGGERFFPAHHVPVVDTTAAGDAFSAALSVALAEGESIERAVEFANAAGAWAVTRLGAQNSLPTRRELETFLSRAQE